MKTFRFVIDPTAKEFIEVDKFLESIKVEKGEGKNEYFVTFDNEMLWFNEDLKQNLLLWFCWFWYLTEMREKAIQEEAEKLKADYAV